ncbi:transposable element Tcb1 transposase [Trichonephila clavipes]|nr:transposable element Tcb1 transposase [Trichonephila clavipes]
MRICDRWMKEGTTDRSGRSHPPQCSTSREDRQIVCMAVTDRSVTSRTISQHIQSVAHHSVHLSATQRWSDSSLETSWREDTEQLRYASPHWSCTGYYGMGWYWISLSDYSSTHCLGTLNNQRYISEVLEPVVLPYLQALVTAIFQQDNARRHVARIVQKFFVNPQIELFPCPARSPNLSPIENMWSTVAQ